MNNRCSWNLKYLRTPMGAVKLVNICFGTVSLILTGVSYVPHWTLDVFIGTVACCLVLNLSYLLFYLLASKPHLQSKPNRVANFVIHVLSGAALVVAGIELIGWSELKDPTCRQDCPRLYTVGVAKTLTFMNGMLCMIVGFLGVKDDDLLDPEFADQELPLLSSTVIPDMSRFPGSKQNLQSSQSYYYDNFMRQPKLPFDQRSVASSFRSQASRPHHLQPTDYSLATSYNSMTQSSRQPSGSKRSRTQNQMTSSINNSLNGQDLRLIKE